MAVFVFGVLAIFVVVFYKTALLVLKSLLWILIIGIPEKLMPAIILGAERRSEIKKGLKARGEYPNLKIRLLQFMNRFFRALVETFTDPINEIRQSVFRK